MIKMACESCPFAFTDESEMIQNYGCLPTPHEIIEMKRESGHNWACHSNEKKLCAGFKEFIEYRQKSPYSIEKYDDIDTSKGGLIPYEVWYHEGREAAMQKADENFKEGKSQLILIVPYDMDWDGEEDIHQVGFSHVCVEKDKGVVKFRTGEGDHVVSLSDNAEVVSWTYSEGYKDEADRIVYWFHKATNEKKFSNLMFEERPLNTKKRCR